MMKKLAMSGIIMFSLLSGKLGSVAPSVEGTGYTVPTSFERAVAMFNADSQKSPVGRTRSKLTVREIELALLTCGTTVSNLQEDAYDALIEILKKRHLPSGSYIMMCDQTYWYIKDGREGQQPAVWMILIQFGREAQEKETVLSGLRLPVRLEYDRKAIESSK